MGSAGPDTRRRTSRLNGFAAHWFLTGLAVTAGVNAVLFLATWVVGRLVGRWNVVDTTWGLSFAVIATTSFLWSAQAPDVDMLRRVLGLALTLAWSLRLAGFIGIRSRGKGEDPRYAAIFEKAKGNPAVFALAVVFGPQAFLSWFVSLPVQIAMYERSAAGILTWVGAAVWAVGVFFEAVGDAQMSAFRKNPDLKGQVMDGGLWHYTRHPNYFGDASVWTGLFLIAAQQWPGFLTVLSPFAMIYFLYFKSGKGLLEKSMAESKPGYAEYMERTSGFIPLPPRHR
jgi:steroid 5-alpha reductase family enzyme